MIHIDEQENISNEIWKELISNLNYKMEEKQKWEV
jgi:hypothetical protein